MPTYEYECRECSHRFEVFQAMSDEPVKTCPLCGKQVRRLIFGGTGVIFKGSGFYVTDKSGGKNPASKTATKTESAGTEKAAACETCPAAASGAACPAAVDGSKAKASA